MRDARPALIEHLGDQRDLVSFKEIKDHIKHTASKPHERSKEEQWAELLIELCGESLPVCDHR